MNKGPLPRFVTEWDGPHIILVWSPAALESIKKSCLLKSKANVTNLDHIITRDCIYRVYVFDSRPAKRLVSNVQLFGGTPTLVVDVSNVLCADIVRFCSEQEQRTIWAFNIPFWSHYFKVIDQQANVTQLAVLLEGNTEYEDEDLRALEELTRISARSYCSSCFVCTIEKLTPTCGGYHYICVDCSDNKKDCFHASHKRELVNDYVYDGDVRFTCSYNECTDAANATITCERCNLCFYCSQLCKELHHEAHQMDCDLFNL